MGVVVKQFGIANWCIMKLDGGFVVKTDEFEDVFDHFGLGEGDGFGRWVQSETGA